MLCEVLGIQRAQEMVGGRGGQVGRIIVDRDVWETWLPPQGGHWYFKSTFGAWFFFLFSCQFAQINSRGASGKGSQQGTQRGVSEVTFPQWVCSKQDMGAHVRGGREGSKCAEGICCVLLGSVWQWVPSSLPQVRKKWGRRQGNFRETRVRGERAEKQRN